MGDNGNSGRPPDLIVRNGGFKTLDDEIYLHDENHQERGALKWIF